MKSIILILLSRRWREW